MRGQKNIKLFNTQVSVTDANIFPVNGKDLRGQKLSQLTLRLLMSYIYGAPSKARNANVVYIWTYVWQR